MTKNRVPITPWIIAGFLFAGCVSLMAAFAMFRPAWPPPLGKSREIYHDAPAPEIDTIPVTSPV